MAEETTETASTKKGVCKKVYIGADGAETRSATPDATELRFTFANGNVHAVKLSDHPDTIQTCLGWFGISEKYGNSYAGAKGDSEVAEESFLSMQEQLVAGTWVDRAEGVGPRPSLIADAIVKALTDSGQEVDSEREKEIREKVKDKAKREGALKDPVIKAAYEQAKAERAADRAKAAAKAAKGSKVGVEGF